MTDVKLIKTVIIKSTPEDVWGFLTEADKLARWFHEANTDLEEGKDYHMLYENPARAGEPLLGGRVLKMEKPHKLVYTFTHKWLHHTETTVTWELTAIDGGTCLTMTHEGIDKAPKDVFSELSDTDKGWDEHFVRLRAVASYY